MDYRKFGECYYIRMDRDDEIISTILEICKKENVRSATFSGIGGCKDAKIQTFIPETGSFEEQRISGMLELVSLNGNVVTGENNNALPVDGLVGSLYVAETSGKDREQSSDDVCGMHGKPCSS